MSSRILLFLFLVGFVVSCSDPMEDRAKDPDIVIPDLEEKITASVSGFVTTESGDPVVYAAVAAGDKEVLTDGSGYFKITGASVPEFAGQVSVISPNYFTGYETFTPNTERESFVRITLLEKPEAKTIAATGGSVTVEGATVQLQANSVVLASTGAAYAGDVKVHVRMLELDEAGLRPGLPGDGRGVDANGHAKVLRSFAPIIIELSTAGGQPLQLASGKLATITLPIASDMIGDAPNTISLWTYNTASGLWEEHGTAQKNGSTYVGTVEHFSFWDGAVGMPMVNLTARVVNSANQPLVHVPVRLTFAGQPVNAGHGSSAFTDANGYVTGVVIANRNYVLDILTPCNTPAYSHNFSAASSDVDLGTLTGNLGQSAVTISGLAKNCDGQNITNGYVQTYDGAFFHRFPVVNGSFSFNGIMCTNTTVSLVAVDLATYKQNTPKEMTLASGTNDAGTLTVCGSSTMGHITYTYDGTTVTIQEPADTLAAYAFDTFTGSQIVTLSGEPNTAQKMAFQLTGEQEIGTNTVTEVFSTVFPSGRGYWPVAINVTITEYDAPGGFISGEFSSNMLDFGDNSVHTFSCSFRVRRYR